MYLPQSLQGLLAPSARCASSSMSHCNATEAGCGVSVLRAMPRAVCGSVLRLLSEHGFGCCVFLITNHKVSPGSTPSQPSLNPTWVHRTLICSCAVRMLRPISREADHAAPSSPPFQSQVGIVAFLGLTPERHVSFLAL